MSDSTGSTPPAGDQPGSQPGQPPAYPPPQQNPYGQQAGQQYGQPYGQEQHGQQPYGGQYGQPGYGQPAYGGYGQATDPDKRPGTVTAAGVITLVMSGLTLLMFGLGLVALAIAREELVDQLRNEPGLESIDPNDIVSVMLVVFLVLLVWCAAAMVLAIFAMRRSNGARIGLVVSSAFTALLSLLGIMSGVSAVPLIAAVAVIICLFTGGAPAWYAGQPGQPHYRQGPVA